MNGSELVRKFIEQTKAETGLDLKPENIHWIKDLGFGHFEASLNVPIVCKEPKMTKALHGIGA